MCGIIGYTGRDDAAQRILEGLQALEYRGYDSAGMALQYDGALKQTKTKGRVAALKEKAHGQPVSHCGIGHTRWATHGEPSDRNAHPHGTAAISLVHNGIIENYSALREELQSQGAVFLSDTDTEAAALLLDRAYRRCGEPLAALREMRDRLTGSYALAVLFRDRPGEIYALRKDSPLLAAVADDGCFAASDLTAVLSQTNRYLPVEEGEIVRIRPEGVTIFGDDGPIQRQVLQSVLTAAAAEKGGEAHFMLKEIKEQPEVLRQTISPRIRDGLPSFEEAGLDDRAFAQLSRIRIVACGTAMHAGMIGKAVMERLARIPVEVNIASEFRYADPILDRNDLVLLISQSGETADTLAALRLAKERGVPTLAVVNAAGSAIAREADRVIYTYAGPEIAVASTKAYSVQMAVMYLLAIRLGLARGELNEGRARELTEVLIHDVPQSVREMLSLRPQCQQIARMLRTTETMFYIGRGMDYVLSMEGSLKMKEITYIHSEAYAAGELKHGTLSLVTPGVPVIAVATDNALYEKTVSNIREVQSRGGEVILLCGPDADRPERLTPNVLRLPRLPSLFSPFPATVFLQTLAYEAAVLRGCDVDHPRNLAKSVTVE